MSTFNFQGLEAELGDYLKKQQDQNVITDSDLDDDSRRAMALYDAGQAIPNSLKGPIADALRAEQRSARTTEAEEQLVDADWSLGRNIDNAKSGLFTMLSAADDRTTADAWQASTAKTVAEIANNPSARSRFEREFDLQLKALRNDRPSGGFSASPNIPLMGIGGTGPQPSAAPDETTEFVFTGDGGEKFTLPYNKAFKARSALKDPEAAKEWVFEEMADLQAGMTESYRQRLKAGYLAPIMDERALEFFSTVKSLDDVKEAWDSGLISEGFLEAEVLTDLAAQSAAISGSVMAVSAIAGGITGFATRNPLAARGAAGAAAGAATFNIEYNLEMASMLQEAGAPLGPNDAMNFVEWLENNKELVSSMQTSASQRAAVIAAGEAGTQAIAGKVGAGAKALTPTKVYQAIRNFKIGQAALGRRAQQAGNILSDMAMQGTVAGAAEYAQAEVRGIEQNASEILAEAVLEAFMGPVFEGSAAGVSAGASRFSERLNSQRKAEAQRRDKQQLLDNLRKAKARLETELNPAPEVREDLLRYRENKDTGDSLFEGTLGAELQGLGFEPLNLDLGSSGTQALTDDGFEPLDITPIGARQEGEVAGGSFGATINQPAAVQGTAADGGFEFDLNKVLTKVDQFTLDQNEVPTDNDLQDLLDSARGDDGAWAPADRNMGKFFSVAGGRDANWKPKKEGQVANPLKDYEVIHNGWDKKAYRYEGNFERLAELDDRMLFLNEDGTSRGVDDARWYLDVDKSGGELDGKVFLTRTAGPRQERVAVFGSEADGGVEEAVTWLKKYGTRKHAIEDSQNEFDLLFEQPEWKALNDDIISKVQREMPNNQFTKKQNVVIEMVNPLSGTIRWRGDYNGKEYVATLNYLNPNARARFIEPPGGGARTRVAQSIQTKIISEVRNALGIGAKINEDTGAPHIPAMPKGFLKQRREALKLQMMENGLSPEAAEAEADAEMAARERNYNLLITDSNTRPIAELRQRQEEINGRLRFLRQFGTSEITQIEQTRSDSLLFDKRPSEGFKGNMGRAGMEPVNAAQREITALEKELEGIREQLETRGAGGPQSAERRRAEQEERERKTGKKGSANLQSTAFFKLPVHPIDQAGADNIRTLGWNDDLTELKNVLQGKFRKETDGQARYVLADQPTLEGDNRIIGQFRPNFLFLQATGDKQVRQVNVYLDADADSPTYGRWLAEIESTDGIMHDEPIQLGVVEGLDFADDKDDSTRKRVLANVREHHPELKDRMSLRKRRAQAAAELRKAREKAREEGKYEFGTFGIARSRPKMPDGRTSKGKDKGKPRVEFKAGRGDDAFEIAGATLEPDEFPVGASDRLADSDSLVRRGDTSTYSSDLGDAVEKRLAKLEELEQAQQMEQLVKEFQSDTGAWDGRIQDAKKDLAKLRRERTMNQKALDNALAGDSTKSVKEIRETVKKAREAVEAAEGAVLDGERYLDNLRAARDVSPKEAREARQVVEREYNALEGVPRNIRRGRAGFNDERRAGALSEAAQQRTMRQIEVAQRRLADEIAELEQQLVEGRVEDEAAAEAEINRLQVRFDNNQAVLEGRDEDVVEEPEVVVEEEEAGPSPLQQDIRRENQGIEAGWMEGIRIANEVYEQDIARPLRNGRMPASYTDAETRLRKRLVKAAREAQGTYRKGLQLARDSLELADTPASKAIDDQLLDIETTPLSESMARAMAENTAERLAEGGRTPRILRGEDQLNLAMWRRDSTTPLEEPTRTLTLEEVQRSPWDTIRPPKTDKEYKNFVEATNARLAEIDRRLEGTADREERIRLRAEKAKLSTLSNVAETIDADRRGLKITKDTLELAEQVELANRVWSGVSDIGKARAWYRQTRGYTDEQWQEFYVDADPLTRARREQEMVQAWVDDQRLHALGQLKPSERILAMTVEALNESRQRAEEGRYDTEFADRLWDAFVQADRKRLEDQADLLIDEVVRNGQLESDVEKVINRFFAKHNGKVFIGRLVEQAASANEQEIELLRAKIRNAIDQGQENPDLFEALKEAAYAPTDKDRLAAMVKARGIMQEIIQENSVEQAAENRKAYFRKEKEIAGELGLRGIAKQKLQMEQIKARLARAGQLLKLNEASADAVSEFLADAVLNQWQYGNAITFFENEAVTPRNPNLPTSLTNELSRLGMLAAPQSVEADAVGGIGPEPYAEAINELDRQIIELGGDINKPWVPDEVADRGRKTSLLRWMWRSDRDMPARLKQAAERLGLVGSRVERNVRYAKQQLSMIRTELQKQGLDLRDRKVARAINAYFEGSSFETVAYLMPEGFELTDNLSRAMKKLSKKKLNIQRDISNSNNVPLHVKAAIADNGEGYLRSSVLLNGYEGGVLGRIKEMVNNGQRTMGKRSLEILEKEIGEQPLEALAQAWLDLNGLPTDREELSTWGTRRMARAIRDGYQATTTKRLINGEMHDTITHNGILQVLSDDYTGEVGQPDKEVLTDFILNGPKDDATWNNIKGDLIREIVRMTEVTPDDTAADGLRSEFQKKELLFSEREQIMSVLDSFILDRKDSDSVWLSNMAGRALREAFPERTEREAVGRQMVQWLAQNRNELIQMPREKAYGAVMKEFPHTKKMFERVKKADRYNFVMREVLRERLDVEGRMIDTIGRLAAIKESGAIMERFLSEAIKEGYVSERQEDGFVPLVSLPEDRSGTAKVNLNLPDSRGGQMHVDDLNNLYANPRVARAFSSLMGLDAHASDDGFNQTRRWLNGMSKYSLVIANLKAHPRNAVSSLIIHAGNTMFFMPGSDVFGKSLGSLRETAKIAGAQMGQAFGGTLERKGTEYLEQQVPKNIVRVAYLRGVLGDGARAEALLDVVRTMQNAGQDVSMAELTANPALISDWFASKSEQDINALDLDLSNPVTNRLVEGAKENARRLSGGAVKAGERVAKVLEEAFRLEDEAVKVAGFISYAGMFNNLMGGPEDLISRYFNSKMDENGRAPEGTFSEQETEILRTVIRMAGDHVRNTYPTFSKTNEMVRFLNRSAVVGAFPSFTAEMARNTTNQLSFLWDLTRGYLPDGREVPSDRKLAAVAVGLQGLTMLSMARIASSLTLPVLGVGATRALLGKGDVGEEEDEWWNNSLGQVGSPELLEALMPDYYANGNLRLIDVDRETGEYTVAMADFLDPTGAISGAGFKAADELRRLALRNDFLRKNGLDDPGVLTVARRNIMAAAMPTLEAFGFRDEVLLGRVLDEIKAIDRNRETKIDSVFDMLRAAGRGAAQGITEGGGESIENAATATAAVATAVLMGTPLAQVLEQVGQAGVALFDDEDSTLGTVGALSGFKMETRNIWEDGARDLSFRISALQDTDRRLKDVISDLAAGETDYDTAAREAGELMFKREEQFMKMSNFFSAADEVLDLSADDQTRLLSLAQSGEYELPKSPSPVVGIDPAFIIGGFYPGLNYGDMVEWLEGDKYGLAPNRGQAHKLMRQLAGARR